MHVARGARALAFAVVIAVVAALAAPVGAADEVIWEGVDAGGPGFAEPIATSWFIELASPPAVKGTSRSQLAQERDALRRSLTRAGIAYSERFAFEDLWNGLSVSLPASAVATVAGISGVRGVYPVETVGIPATVALSDPAMWTAISQSGASTAQGLGWTGGGIKVAVMDTGIDYHHPDLGGCFGSGCRVVVGKDFVGDGYNASGSTAHQTVPRPDPNPDDCNGHGTHVAGIIGASGDAGAGGVRGVAPGVTFGAYRVFGCDGSTSADIMVAAMERALADGMHVLNMSIGSSFQWPTYPTAVAASNLVDSGVVVVASIGNSGSSGVYSQGAPGNGDKVIGVASFDNTHINSLTFNVTTSGRQVPYQPLSTTPAAPTSGTSATIVHVGRGCVQDPALGLAADDPYLADPSGKVALIERGVCTFNTKYQRGVAAGAVGVIIYAAASAPGLFLGGSVNGVDGVFGITVARADGLHLIGQTAPAAEWTDARVTIPISSGTISSFSSYGHAPDLSLKPDIGAPGGFIFSTLPLERGGGYGVLSGTSMSSPHVAGAVALYLQARPGASAGDVRTILQNSADPRFWFGAPSGPFIEAVHRQGAGMLDVPGAIAATTRVSPGKIALGESVPTASQVKQLTIANNGTAAATYSFGHQAALSTTGSMFSPSFSTSAATVALPAPVTVPAGANAVVNVTITAPASTSANHQYGGYITVNGGGATYRVPYAGFRGDYQAISALTPTTNGFPWLAKRVATTVGSPLTDWAKQSAGAVYTLKHGTDVPWVLFHLDHQVSRLTIDVHEADGTLWGRVLDTTNFTRSSTSTSWFSLSWDGKASSPTGPSVKNVKNATYYFRLSVVKALGDASDPAHVQSWTSPAFVINREIEEP